MQSTARQLPFGPLFTLPKYRTEQEEAQLPIHGSHSPPFDHIPSFLTYPNFFCSSEGPLCLPVVRSGCTLRTVPGQQPVLLLPPFRRPDTPSPRSLFPSLLFAGFRSLVSTVHYFLCLISATPTSTSWSRRHHQRSRPGAPPSEEECPGSPAPIFTSRSRSAATLLRARSMFLACLSRAVSTLSDGPIAPCRLG
jgi:hypothetical protein